jgi:uncharacterized protein YbaA (DUF1428 family)
MTYVDGFVAAVPIENKDTYRRLAEEAASIFKEHGALRVVECWGDALAKGSVTDFPAAVQAGEGETVIFSWIVWPSKEARDEGNRKVMSDERMKVDGAPFDARRMIYGGFEVLIDL